MLRVTMVAKLTKTATGFTLIEVVVIIVVISILSSVGYFGFHLWRDQVAATELENDLNGVYTAMESARNWSDGYPTLTAGTQFNGGSTTQAIFTQSKNVQLIYRSGNAKEYCIDAVSVARPSVKWFLTTAGGNKNPQSGTCAS